nr:retinol-binding protein pinta-like isoform X2 [Onthophagus taurus]
MKDWLKEIHPKIHSTTDDLFLLAFLRGCKFNLDKTKHKLNNYNKMRTEIPEWFSNRNPNQPNLLELIKLGVFIPLRKLHENQHVVIIRTAAHNPKLHKQDDVFKTGMMILDLLGHQNEMLQIYGIIAIFDMKGISLSHAKQLPPSMIKKAVFSWQNYHCRPKQLEFINAPTYINVVLNVFKRFMSEKLKGRIRVHFYGYETLHKVVSKDVLPMEYGGNNGELKDHIEYWTERILESSEWFKLN